MADEQETFIIAFYYVSVLLIAFITGCCLLP